VVDVMTEKVLVIPTKVFHDVGYFQGFTSKVDSYLDSLFCAEHTSYRPRNEVERDPSYKQLIPYVIFRHRDGSGHDNVFQYTRGTGQGEGRLHRKRSVGIGGHISVVDVNHETDSSAYDEGMRREIDEEVIVETPYEARCVGLINDDETDVGRVHLGVVHVFDVERPAVRPREPDIAQSGFLPVREILKDLEGFETWSQICLEALFKP
jgi:predicted NUDIX family phosphoesterase